MGAVATLLASVPLFLLANRHRAERAAVRMTRLDVAAETGAGVVRLPLGDARTSPARRRSG